jgi:carboxymethylenebutenolidase
MASVIEYRRPDGSMCPGYLAEPQAVDDAPGVVLIQEWWGLNRQIKKAAERLAQVGYRALVPDLFRGKVAKDADEASHLMQGLNFEDAAQQDIQGAVTYLKARSKKCAVAGFCMGGALTMVAGAQVLGVDAGVVFYGIPPKKLVDPSTLSLPLQFHFAEQDDWCTPAVVNELEEDLKRSKSSFEFYRYEGAQHAFMNEARPEVFEPKSARLAWDRTQAFLKRLLQPEV